MYCRDLLWQLSVFNLTRPLGHCLDAHARRARAPLFQSHAPGAGPGGYAHARAFFCNWLLFHLAVNVSPFCVHGSGSSTFCQFLSQRWSSFFFLFPRVCACKDCFPEFQLKLLEAQLGPPPGVALESFAGLSQQEKQVRTSKSLRSKRTGFPQSHAMKIARSFELVRKRVYWRHLRSDCSEWNIVKQCIIYKNG